MYHINCTHPRTGKKSWDSASTTIINTGYQGQLSITMIHYSIDKKRSKDIIANKKTIKNYTHIQSRTKIKLNIKTCARHDLYC